MQLLGDGAARQRDLGYGAFGLRRRQPLEQRGGHRTGQLVRAVEPLDAGCHQDSFRRAAARFDTDLLAVRLDGERLEADRLAGDRFDADRFAARPGPPATRLRVTAA